MKQIFGISLCLLFLPITILGLFYGLVSHSFNHGKEWFRNDFLDWYNS